MLRSSFISAASHSLRVADVFSAVQPPSTGHDFAFMAAIAGSDTADDLWIENGRGYGNNRRGQYLLPVDAKEQERLDIMHTMILAARPKPKRLHHAPFQPRENAAPGQNSRVLDLGFGTGIWLLDMAEKYPAAEFHGFDISTMDAGNLYHNIDFKHIDYESPWAMGEESFDLIHLQMGLGSVGNWPLLYHKIFQHLKPGGYFEHVEIDWTPRSEDHTLPSDGMLVRWWTDYVGPPYSVVGRPIMYNPNTEQLLSQRGFINVEHEVYRIPTHGWSNIKSEHVSGLWWENAMAFGEGRGHGFEALSLAVLTRVQQWPVEHARKLCEDAMREARNPAVHAFTNLHIYWAQRPPNT